MKSMIQENKLVKTICSTTLLSLLFTAMALGGDIPPYRNANLDADARTRDLISRMTLEEKVGQLMSPYGWEMYEREGDEVRLSEKFLSDVSERHIGMLWGTFRADPWTQKDFRTGLNPRTAARVANMMQRHILENTRLGIPIFLAEEAPHGHMAIGSTVFPTAVGQASTWNPELVERMAEAISREVRLQGAHISYGPVLDIARDARWSRVEECYGEDPALTSAMGAAFVRGLGGGDLSRPWSTVSTLKHFIAYGSSEGGQNGSASLIGERELREIHLPPFRAAVGAGALSVMTSYNSIDGIPCTANPYLIKDVLKTELGFRGFVISDLVSIEGLCETHFVAADYPAAARLAMESGVDVDLCGNAFQTLISSVKEGNIDEKLIDEAVYRVLRLKFEMGLFENPYIDEELSAAGVGSQEHSEVALEVARQSVTLLENRNNILPLDPSKIGKIAVIGPNADNGYNQLGDYTAPQQQINTVLDGIIEIMGADRVVYAKGCGIREGNDEGISGAVEAVESADIAVVVVGGSSARDFNTMFLETGAAVARPGGESDMDSGEGYDRATLDLLGRQQELLEAIKATGKPMIVVYVQGRPLDMNWAAGNADALLTAWYPGSRGGDAVAEVIFGRYNPAGRLPVSVPRSVGQVPIHYNKRQPRNHDYTDMPGTPLYPFGYGLSYTTFEYSNLRVADKGGYHREVSFDVTNTGDYDGDEVVQLYVRDILASTVRPAMALKKFARISDIKRGEMRNVVFELGFDDFSLINARMEEVVERGEFRIMIGPSSHDIRLDGVMDVD
ncbi:MAG: glycoside hydrolase family 3 C-terminal domain-containing protein [Rikenellaceae bacterium]|nr:glycoside hydrolase family 3 C-terminal domain-containing protein [Rikenellaceae bacterium]